MKYNLLNLIINKDFFFLNLINKNDIKKLLKEEEINKNDIKKLLKEEDDLRAVFGATLDNNIRINGEKYEKPKFNVFFDILNKDEYHQDKKLYTIKFDFNHIIWMMKNKNKYYFGDDYKKYSMIAFDFAVFKDFREYNNIKNFFDALKINGKLFISDINSNMYHFEILPFRSRDLKHKGFKIQDFIFNEEEKIYDFTEEKKKELENNKDYLIRFRTIYKVKNDQKTFFSPKQPYFINLFKKYILSFLESEKYKKIKENYPFEPSYDGLSSNSKYLAIQKIKD